MLAAIRPRLPVLFVLALLAAVPALWSPRAASAAPTPLRDVDWSRALLNHPQLYAVPPENLPAWAATNGVYVIVSGPNTTISFGADGFPEVSGDDALAGFVVADSISYGDLDGDGREEAAVPLISGGTGGAFGFLLFREGEGYPRLVTGLDGYKSGVNIEGGVLTYLQPIYAGFEPNCCPSGSTTTRYILSGDELVPIGATVEPFRETIRVTVQAFYQALNEGRYTEAYDFLSPRAQAGQPLPNWVLGYGTTRCVQAETSAPDARNTVSVTITSRDSTPSGGSIVRRFAGIWSAVWSDTRLRWLLDRSDIREVAGFAATAEGRAFCCE